MGIPPGGMQQQQLAGSPGQQQQRWESERESDKSLESMEVESWKNDVGQCRKLSSSEIMSPPNLQDNLHLQHHLTEQQQSQELYNINTNSHTNSISSSLQGPALGQDPESRMMMMNMSTPLELLDYHQDQFPAQGSTSQSLSQGYSHTSTRSTDMISNDPYSFLPSNTCIPPTSATTSQISSPPSTAYLPSTSVEGVNRPPSFAEVMRSRSQSIELEKGIMSQSPKGDSASGSRRASYDAAGSIPGTSGGIQYPRTSLPSTSSSIPTGFIGDPMMATSSSTSAATNSAMSTGGVYIPQHPHPSVSPPCQLDEKASSLMEELSKLQSAVDNTLKRRQRQTPVTGGTDRSLRFSPRSRSPSPSPMTSPVRDRFGVFKSPPESPNSPQRFSRSPPKLDFGSPIDSPDSPEVPGVRKAIVLKEHDLDDYKSSSDEEGMGEESDDDDLEEHPGSSRKGGGVIMMGAHHEAFYDHSPGEVYTIPEEEDEGGSPTGGDLVTSLSSRPGECYILLLLRVVDKINTRENTAALLFASWVEITVLFNTIILNL